MDSVARAAAHFGFRVNPFSRLFTIILVTPPIQGDDESYLTTIDSLGGGYVKIDKAIYKHE